MTVASLDRVVRSREALLEALDAAPSDLLRLLPALVATLQPRHVLEFGSGVSTAVLARAATELGDCAVTSVDHDPQLIAATSELIESGHPSRCSTPRSSRACTPAAWDRRTSSTRRSSRRHAPPISSRRRPARGARRTGDDASGRARLRAMRIDRALR